LHNKFLDHKFKLVSRLTVKFQSGSGLYLELIRFCLECVDGDDLLESVETDQDESVVKLGGQGLGRRHLVDSYN